MGQIEVIMLGPGRNQPGGIATIENLICVHIPPGVSVTHFSTHEDASVIRRILVFAKCVARVVSTLSKGGIAAVHIHMACDGSVIRKSLLVLAAKMMSAPVILHAHSGAFKQFHSKLPRVGKRLIGIIFRQCDYFLTLSQSWQEFYRDTYKLREDSVLVFPNAIKIPEKIPTKGRNGKVKIVFLGRIRELKGAFDLIHSYAELPESLRESSEMVLAGDGDISGARYIIESYPKPMSVSTPGRISVGEKEQLLSESHIFVLPSYNEGVPMAMLEAMAWGLAVVVTPVGGIPEVVTSWRNGVLVRPGHRKELVKALEVLIEDQNLRAELGIVARESIAHLNITDYCLDLASLYKAAFEGRPFVSEVSRKSGVRLRHSRTRRSLTL